MQTLSNLLPATALAVAALVFSGCETESAGTASVSINPGYARITAGQSVALSASGGNNHRWSLSNGSYGHLSASSGSSVVYTASKDSVTQVVTLNSTLGSSSYQCQATIVQGNDEYASTITPTTSSSQTSSGENKPSSSDNGALSITVTKREILKGLRIKATLRASGGIGGYTWKITGDSSKGTLSSNGATATYTAAEGLEDYTQTVSVTDGSGTSATQSIWHNSQAGDIQYQAYQ